MTRAQGSERHYTESLPPRTVTATIFSVTVALAGATTAAVEAAAAPEATNGNEVKAAS